jgi:hypothetical protein
MSEPVAWIRQRDNVLAINDGGVFGDDWTPLYSAALAQPEQQLTLTFDAFVKQIRDKALYETIYEDTEGREILVITLLHAYVLMRRTALPQRKPLTSGELYTAYITATNQTLRPQDERLAFAFARAIEKAHGII